MSTKIYDGLIATTTNPFTVRKKIDAVLEPIFYERFTKVIEQAMEARAARTLSWAELSHDFLGTATGRAAELIKQTIPDNRWECKRALVVIIDELFKSPTHNFSSLDFGYEYSILENRSNGMNRPRPRPLVLVFSEAKNALIKAAMDAGVVAEYGYWNNSDEPDESEVSAEEWAARKRAWGPVAKGSDGFLIRNPNFHRLGELTYQAAAKARREALGKK